MKTVRAWVVVWVVGVAAAPGAAYAATLMSNGVGDGEANVPFASVTKGAAEGAGRDLQGGLRRSADHAKVAGRSGRTAARSAPPASGAEPATQADRALEELIWTAP